MFFLFVFVFCFFFQAEDGIRDVAVTGVQTCALPIYLLREEKIEFDYEKLEYVLVEKFRHEGVYFKMTPKAKEMKDRTASMILPIKYTPDFVAKDGSWIIETKGYTPSHHDFPMRWKLFLKHLNDQDEPIPMLFICKNKQQVAEAIQIIKNGGTK